MLFFGVTDILTKVIVIMVCFFDIFFVLVRSTKKAINAILEKSFAENRADVTPCKQFGYFLAFPLLFLLRYGTIRTVQAMEKCSPTAGGGFLAPDRCRARVFTFCPAMYTAGGALYPVVCFTRWCALHGGVLCQVMCSARRVDSLSAHKRTA